MTILDRLTEAFSTYVLAPLKTMTWVDAVDILLLAVVFYYIVIFVRDRRARNLIVGFLTLAVVYFVTWICGLTATYTLFRAIFSVYVVFLIVIFQYDLRDGLDKLGTRVLRLHRFGSQPHTIATVTATIGVLSEAVCELSKEKCGALIVVERNSKLGDYIKTGVELDALMSCELLGNLFFNRSPLHESRASRSCSMLGP